MQIILVKYIQLFCVTLFFSNNVKCDQLLLRNDNEDKQLYSLASCTARCLKNDRNLTLEDCYENCIKVPMNETKQLRQIYRNLEVKFICRDDTSFVIEIINKYFNNINYYNMNNSNKKNNYNNISYDQTFKNDILNNNTEFYLVEEKEKEKQQKNESKNKKRNVPNELNDETQFQVYILKVHEADKFPVEKKIYLTNSNLIRIDNLQPNTKYYVSVTDVTSNNEFCLIANGITYRTLKKKYMPKEISNVKVSYISDKTVKDSLSAQISWTPAADQTCYYDIVWYSPEIMNNFDLAPFEIRDIEQLYTYTIKNLSFGTRYQVAVRGKNTKDLSKESDLIWHSIKTPTCLEWHQGKWTCPPLKPENLSTYEKHISHNIYSLNISWNEPNFLPNYYLLRIRDLNMNISKTDVKTLNISNNYSSIFLPEVTFNGIEYEVNLTAVSEGGTSSAAIMARIFDFPHIPDKYMYIKIILGICGTIIFIGIIFVVVLFILLHRTKAKRFRQRFRYLKELKRKGLISNNSSFSISGKMHLNDSGDAFDEHYSLQEKIYINDEKEIERENLKLFEILGEGAFGLVRRGELRLSDTKVVEVAVKMLKDKPLCEDIKAFRREIDVMKSVGCHPNIVGIVGHYTKSVKEYMLLTEYCSLGNLQNYLRCEWRYLNKIAHHETSKPSKDLQINKKENSIFNYNSSLIDKRRMQYKNISCNVTNSYPLRQSFSLPLSSFPNNQNILSTNSFISLKTVDNEKIDEISYNKNNSTNNDNVILKNLVINKGYELETSCTNACKCRVDIFIKNQNNHNNENNKMEIIENNQNISHSDNNIINKTNGDTINIFHQNNENRICEIEIKNCDCAEINKNWIQKCISSNVQTNSSLNGECHNTEILSETNVPKTTTIIKNKIYYGLTSNDKEGSQKITITTASDISSTQLISHRDPITSYDLLYIAKQIALGMEFLSKNKVVHRDLAARNVLVCSNHVVKIADFGLSRDIYQENIYKKTGNGKLPIKWLALESLTHQIYTSQSDVWSYGILLSEIVTLGETPYPSIPNHLVLDLLKSGYRMEKPKTCDDEIYNLMSSCWQANPSNRPSFTQIVKVVDKFLMNEPEKHIFNLISPTYWSKQAHSSSTEPSYLTPI